MLKITIHMVHYVVVQPISSILHKYLLIHKVFNIEHFEGQKAACFLIDFERNLIFKINLDIFKLINKLEY